MDRINGAGTTDIGGGRRGFIDEDLGLGREGTEVTALFLNMVQEEMAKVIEEANLALNPADWTQLLQALRLMGLSFGARSRRWTAVISSTLSSAPGAPARGDTYLIPAGATGIWATNVGQIAEWTGSEWMYTTPPDGHGISLPSGRIFVRMAGTYGELLASDTFKGLVELATIAEAKAGLSSVLAVTPEGLAAAVPDYIAANKSPFNLLLQTVAARTVLSGTGFVNLISGNYLKKSSTSNLLVRASTNLFSSGGAAAGQMRALVGGQQFTVICVNMTSGGNSASPNGAQIFTGLPAGNLAWTLAFGRTDGLSWTSVINPSSTDSSNLPPSGTVTSLELMEFEP